MEIKFSASPKSTDSKILKILKDKSKAKPANINMLKS